MNQDRDRILRMIEAGQVSAEEASRLLDALAAEQRVADRVRARLLRVRVSELPSGRPKANVTIPVGLINVGLRLGARLGPQLSDSAMQELLRSIERGATGRLFEWQDLEEGERIEIFVDER
ncbi:MAG: SHOCT-like domain-containing protein [Oscillochloridaceae bacterium umkhey_bin13]